MDCLGFADDKAVFYEATVDMCTLPAVVTLQVSQPDTDFLFAGTYYSDMKPPKRIGNYIISSIQISLDKHLDQYLINISIDTFIFPS